MNLKRWVTIVFVLPSSIQNSSSEPLNLSAEGDKAHLLLGLPVFIVLATGRPYQGQCFQKNLRSSSWRERAFIYTRSEV